MITGFQDGILKVLRTCGTVSRDEIGRALSGVVGGFSRTTLIRALNSLVDAGFVERTGEGRSTRYALSSRTAMTMPVDLEAYFSQDVDDRVLRSDRFNFDVFRELHGLMAPRELAELDALNDRFRVRRERLTPTLLRKEFERLTIELAWKSSRIEGNTYTLLDTERLLRDGVACKGKSAAETRMVLNHKAALGYVLERPEDYRTLSVAKIEDIHALVTRGLDVGQGIRSGMVGIVGTNYRPLDNRFQIQEALERLVDLLADTDSTLERALIAVLMISYIQPFEDGNKRTARILGNAILLADDYCPLSYRSVNEVEYKKAVVLFYEQNNVGCFKRLFMDQFRQAVTGYF